MLRPITTLQEKQDIAYTILTEFDRYCRSHQLCYTLAFGTLLGAVRHKAFIPWDDDIDVIMPRPDYDRFLAESAGCFNGRLKVLTVHNTPDYHLAFAKIIDSGTVFYEAVRKPCKGGVFIDIFPADGVPSDEKERALYCEELKTQLKRIYYTTRRVKKEYTLCKKICRFTRYGLIRLFHDRKKEVEKLEEMARRYDYESSALAAVTCSDDTAKSVMTKAELTERIELPFRDRLFYVPAAYDALLTRFYGSYMELPPLEKRKGHPGEAYRIE